MSTLFNADEIFKIGIQIEKNGREFYLAAATKTSDTALKSFFAKLADWESKHAELFESLRSTLPPTIKLENVYDPNNEIHLYLKSVADNTIFVEGSGIVQKISTCQTPLEILQKALEFEKDSVVFYSSMKQIVPDNLGKHEVDKLVFEELFHVGQITKEIQKIQK